MSIHPPKALAPKNNLPQNPVSASLEHEVLAEKAATYSRLVMKLEKALAQLREFEFAHANFAPDSRGPARARPDGGASMTGRPAGGLETAGQAEYETLLDRAGQALWYVIVQRDLCGFRRHDLFYNELNVPHSVRLRMGIARTT
jgi:hypothetical protein